MPTTRNKVAEEALAALSEITRLTNEPGDAQALLRRIDRRARLVLEAAAKPEAKPCAKCNGEGLYICAKWGLPRECEACGVGRP